MWLCTRFLVISADLSRRQEWRELIRPDLPPHIGCAWEMSSHGGSIRFPSSCFRPTPYLPTIHKSSESAATTGPDNKLRAYHGHANQLCQTAAAGHEGRAAADAFLLVASDLLTTTPIHPCLPVHTVHPLILPFDNKMLLTTINALQIVHRLVSQHITTHPTLSTQPGVILHVSACLSSTHPSEKSTFFPS